MIETITPKVPMAISASLNVDEVRVLARSTEAISDAANRVDQRIGLSIVDLAADASDIDVDDVRRRIEMQIPHVLQQHRAGDDLAFVARQIFQKPEFARQQLDVLAVPAGGPRDQVDGKIADAQDCLLGDRLAAPAECLQPREQLDKGKWLDQIVVASGAQAADLVVDLAERADDQEGGGDAVVAELPHHRDAVDI